MFFARVLIFIISLANYRSFSLPLKFEKSPEEGELFEGDILGVERGAAQIPTSSRIKWDPLLENRGAVIPYEFNADYSQQDIDIILSAFKMVEENTRFNSKRCIKFVPKTNQDTYIRVINDTGCYSYVGKQNKTGYQILSLRSPGCIVKGIVAHEFIHALGFWHEQSRPDRDNFIDVLFENIEKGKENNFNKYETYEVDYLKQTYDYKSIMHYGSSSFSVNGKPTIVAKDTSQYIGQRKELSEIDIIELQTFYNCRDAS